MEEGTLISQLEAIGKQIADAYRSKIESKDAMVHAVPSALHEFTWIVGRANDKWMLVFNLPNEWAFVEDGRRPGKFPPPDAIRKWITAKPIVPHADERGRVPSTSQLVFLISRSIAKHGINARPILSTTLQDNYNLVDKFVSTIAAVYGREVSAELIDIPTAIENIKIKL